MRLRGRFVALFALMSVLSGASSIVVAYRAMGGEYRRAESELAPGGMSAAGGAAEARARDSSLSAEERARSALAALEWIRAAQAGARLFRDQALVEAARRIGGFALLWTVAAALLFALAARPLTRRLAELTAGALRAPSERGFRFPPASDLEFGPVFDSFNAMLDTIAEQEARLEEAARLEGWREVSSFLFHQLRSPLAALELASRNVELAASRGASGAMPAAEALAACSSSAASGRAECARSRALLDRFKAMAGLALGPAQTLGAGELAAACGKRIAPGKATLSFDGEDAAISGDRRMLEEALMNLVINSAEACPAPPARVTARARREGASVFIEVADSNGPVDPGLPARLSRERFSTKPEGTGLGLLFVRRVAALHGGSFSVSLGPDGGLVAELQLPAGAEARP